GLGQGTANSLDLLPDKHNDFIFGVVAEEGGFVAAASLLALYMIVAMGGFNISQKAEEPAGRLIAAGCASLLGAQVLINVGVVTAVLPTTGITLPLVSYGGSSMIVTFALVGLMLNVGASKPITLRDSFTGRNLE
ncbi:MAG: FtsW/RodA/SpoVE family cell cycle protein, partial [Planctomycetes bacterium]|nr:FtsW/RodA/SpoVE family cell cycle protein [Planctomycetota bacterium]